MDSIDAEERYEEMYRQAYPVVLRYCQRRLPADAARDAAADVFLVAWRRFKDVPDPALPWLIRTASLTVQGDGRRTNRAARLTARVAVVDPPVAVPDHAVADKARVRAALARLSVQDRELLMLTSWDDLDLGTAAAVLGCSRAAIRVRLHRARRRLAVLLDARLLNAALAAPLHSVPRLEEPA